MSALEFAEWKAIFAHEELHPATHRARHAQLLAATLNGPAKRRDRRLWRGADFLPVDPWTQLAAQRTAPRQLTTQQLASQVAALNRLIQP